MKRKLVISVNGGGALGIGPLAFMKKLEEDLGTKLADISVAFAGTSTGSIIASGLDYGYSAAELFDLYKKNLNKIFDKVNIVKRLMKGYKYDNTNLYKMLKDNLPGKIYELKKPIFIPVTHMNGESVEKVWDLGDDEDLAFCILTSCSAPTYFPVVQKNGSSYCDGGMWANSPIMVLESGLKKNNPNINMKILAFNTGMEPPNEDSGENRNILKWAEYVIEDWVARTGNSNYYEACANIGSENVFRCSPKIDKILKMDDLSDKTMNKVISTWETYYNDVKDDLIKWINEV